MNQLNNIRVNGEKLPVVVKQELYRELFCNVEKPRKVTVKGIADFLKIKGFYEKEIDITGMDTEISANLKAMIDFRRIVGQDKLKEEIIDEIIQKIIILGESGL